MFRICFDYLFESTNFNQLLLAFVKKAYPEEKCSGGPNTASNYWFALKGHWFSNGSLTIDFVNTLDKKLGSMHWLIVDEEINWKMAVEAQV